MIAALVVAAAVLFVVGCGDDQQGSSPGSKLDDPGPVHVHGLGINPKDGALFISTTRAFSRRGGRTEGERRSTRVADRYQDTMGFTIAGPDRFLGSGHPDFQKDPDLPPLLGLIRSEDAGQSWEPVSMLGANRLYLIRGDGSVSISRDSGKAWRQVGEIGGRPAAFEAEGPRDLYAALHDGTVQRSTDGGQSWEVRSRS
jgi:photosystem II stability/assembly factor-like uncharacterized protein